MKLGYVNVPGRGRTDLLIADIAARLDAAGIVLAGTVQSNTDRPDRRACDMDLHLLPDGPVIRISEERGAGARGCHLDMAALSRAVHWVGDALPRADMLIINKFGIEEAAGRGLIPVIGEALSRDMPVLVGVNDLNLKAFQDFSSGMAVMLPADAMAVAEWCHAALISCGLARHAQARAASAMV